ncbi:hypothetical protein ABFS82_14G084400 [Erythranthe guttata]|uniref:Agenet domain-containing protein n=1 Tax=Erythranthe guttata TaxID=4155 RepID=A0A022RF68_ERYGU|nr:PREDICTED: uncharacterized protein LOC105956595 [Erythranthe guttata]EYU38408.1 hypothetical protein MIMGU_mgv1a009346mg [Erythranthe guttata]|eukprot:XP_012835901.1 PREDICTED: uncharacterized protein LOC105956595 [Erythranthe guttata]
MAGVNADLISQYFKKGADVEISSDEEGFRGSLYAGTVIRPPGNLTSRSAKVMVEYKTLMEDKAGKRRLREEVELVQLRPPPPEENRPSFKFSDEVDAYYNDGWWEGIITQVVGEDNKYSVFFRGSREQITFKASNLRLHREWANGMWVPPLEPAEPSPAAAETPKSESRRSKTSIPAAKTPKSEGRRSKKRSLSNEVEANEEVVERTFNPGEHVEVQNDEEGFEGAWFGATVMKNLKEGKYLVEYQTLRNDDDTNFLREEVDSLHIRPVPPDVELIDRFEVDDEVDASCNDGWWRGTISKVLKNDRYSVYFKTSDEELKFNHSDLRVHQEWINGKWNTASKALKF